VLGRQPRARGGVEVVAGRRLTIEPGVFSPRVFRTGAWLAEFAANGVVRPGDAVLDLGTGSGVGALAVAGIAARVVAVDVSVEAVRCARANARVNGLAGRVDVREGDLFEPLAAGERFDLVLFNPPFYRGVPGSASDAAWRSVDVPERFADGLAGRLTARGRALVVLSSDCDVDGWLRGSRERGLEVRLVARREFANEALLLYRIAPPARTRQTEGGA
jgi:release factor glutamine methyltransferase